MKKVKNQDSMGKTNFFFSTLPLGNFSHMAACRSSSKNIRKMNLIHVFNKNSPWAHTLVENGSFTTTFTTAFAVVHDTYDCYSIFNFVVIVDKS
jgi:hypothetical protein